MKNFNYPALVLLSLLFYRCGNQPEGNLKLKLEVSYDLQFATEPYDGRLLVMLSADSTDEPRFQINSGPDSQLIFGLDVDQWAPDESIILGEDIFGYPVQSLAKIKAGEYYIQALLHKYETFNRSDGHKVKLPMDRGEGQKWNKAPGNLLSKPQKVYIDPQRSSSIHLVMDQEIDSIPAPKDTKYIKHVRIQSRLLTEFWGRPMYLGAHVLLPEGFEEHPEARYPLAIFHGHFPYDFDGFREEPPDPALKPDYSERFDVHGYNKIMQQEAYDFYKTWTGPDFPRMIIIKIQHANPYYDDSYAVNSANLGPYGDAITHELVPFIEEKFRGIGEGWARFLYGGSTGGWEALAAQVMYPDEYNGCFAACPDPIDFRAYMLVDLYNDENAYYYNAAHKKVRRPGHRDYLGHVNSSMEDYNHLELVLGTNSRSGDQFDIWEAVYSPAGENGYPKRIWDKLTGEIDHDVAAYWRENYDLRYILERDWPQLGPRLKGKIHIYCGDMDNYYLNNAVYLMEEFLENTQAPYYDGEIDYGDRAEHCWNGDHENPNHISRSRYNTMYVSKILDRINKSAPLGSDLSSWKY